MQHHQTERQAEQHAQLRERKQDYVVSVTRALAEYAERGGRIVIESEREDSLAITFRLDDPDAYHDLLSELLRSTLAAHAEPEAERPRIDDTPAPLPT